jgi:hypothetical protein
MRSGSSGHDERGWSPAQHPYSGRGPQPPREDVPLGPEISWPNGFRQLDRGHQQAPAYQQPAMDDYGYGDPGYADPSYDGDGGYYAPPAPPAPGPVRGPVTPPQYSSAPPAYEPPAYQPPAYEPAPPQYDAAPAAYQLPPGASMAPDPVYPVTGAQEIYREPDHVGSRYDEPRQSDPRLEGLRYDELHYDDTGSGGQFDDPDYDQSRYDEPLDDEAWFAELRRGGPAFGPNPGGPNPGGPAGPGPGPAGNGRFQPAPVYDRSPGYPPAPAPAPANGNGNENGRGYDTPRMSVVPAKGPGGPAGPGSPMGPARGSVAVQPGLAHQTTPTFPHAPGFQQGVGRGPSGPGFAGQPQAGPAPMAPIAPIAPIAPAAALPPGPVSVLTPPAGSRFDTRDAPQARPFSAPAPAGPPPVSGPMPTMPRPEAPAGLGPDTVAWDMTAEVDQLEVIGEYWDAEDGDGGYAALLHDLETDPEPRDYLRDTGPQPAIRQDTRRHDPRKLDPRRIDPRRIGRRRSGSNDHRLWLGLGGVVVVAAAAIFGIIKLEFPPAGPSHELVTPASVVSYQWSPALEKKSDLAALRKEFSQQLGIPISQVVSREYESGAAPGASTPEIVMYLGGHLPNQSPANSLANFQQKYKNAVQVNAGPMGGDAVCVETALGTTNSVAQCAWFDDDSVGVLDSPTMTISQLASVMLRFRPEVELTRK